jgi:hypothetical protein
MPYRSPLFFILTPKTIRDKEARGGVESYLYVEKKPEKRGEAAGTP